MMGEKIIKKRDGEGKWQYPTDQANTACDLRLPSAHLPQIKIFQRTVQYTALKARGNGSTGVTFFLMPISILTAVGFLSPQICFKSLKIELFKILWAEEIITKAVLELSHFYIMS